MLNEGSRELCINGTRTGAPTPITTIAQNSLEFPQIKTVEAKNGGGSGAVPYLFPHYCLYKKDWHQNLILFIFRLAPIVSGCCGMSLVTVAQ